MHKHLKSESYKGYQIYFTRFTNLNGTSMIEGHAKGMKGVEVGRTKDRVVKLVKYRIDNFIRY